MEACLRPIHRGVVTGNASLAAYQIDACQGRIGRNRIQQVRARHVNARQGGDRLEVFRRVRPCLSPPKPGEASYFLKQKASSSMEAGWQGRSEDTQPEQSGCIYVFFLLYSECFLELLIQQFFPALGTQN